VLLCLELGLQVLKAFLNLDTRVYYGLALLTLLYMFYVGSLTSPIIVFIFVLCTGCMIFTAYLAQWVLAKDEGPLEMSEVCSMPTYSCVFCLEIDILFLFPKHRSRLEDCEH